MEKIALVERRKVLKETRLVVGVSLTSSSTET
jgi:hypothetical protein